MSEPGSETNEDVSNARIRPLMLLEMDEIIARGLETGEKVAYTEACRQNPDYARSPELRMRFLRVENFNTGLAAHRLCQYFDFKLQWFGEDLLGRPLSISELSSDDLAVLRRGDLQMLQESDAKGRKVAYYSSNGSHRLKMDPQGRFDFPSPSDDLSASIRYYEAVSD